MSEQQPEQPQEVDISTISKDDVFFNLMNAAKQFSVHLMVCAGLLEQIAIRDQPKDEQPEAPAHED